MTDPKDSKTPTDELREGLSHFFAAARKVAQNMEPQVNKQMEDAERLLGKLTRGGEVLATEVSKEVTTFAGRVAERLRQATDRQDESHPDGHPHGGTAPPPTSTPPEDKK